MAYSNKSDPFRIAITGATGSIASHLMPDIAKGMLNKDDRPIELKLYVRNIDDQLQAQKMAGLAKELRDHGAITHIRATDNLEELFEDIDCAFLLGSIPRKPDQPRSSVLEPNAGIFTQQGKAINDFAKRDAKILVVGNPANTNALIVNSYTPDLEPNSVTSLMYLDTTRMKAKAGCKLNIPPNMIENAFAMGNHSESLVPNLDNASYRGREILQDLPGDWYTKNFTPSIQKRGQEIGSLRKKTSSSSAAWAALSHMNDWIHGTQGRIISMGVPSNGSYGIDEGVIFGLPVSVDYNGRIEIIEGMKINPAHECFMNESYKELLEERSRIEHLLNHCYELDTSADYDYDNDMPAPV